MLVTRFSFCCCCIPPIGLSLSPLFIRKHLPFPHVGVNWSKAGQNDVSCVWRDHYHNNKLPSNLKIMLDMIERSKETKAMFPRFGEYAPGLEMTGTFKDIELQALGNPRRGPRNGPGDVATARRQGKALVELMLEKMPIALGLSDSDILMMNALDVRKIEVGGGPVGASLDQPFLDFAKFLRDGSMSHLAVDADLRVQFNVFKERYAENYPRFAGVWHHKNSRGQDFLDHQAVLETFLNVSYGLHEGIPDVCEIVEVTVVSSRSQSDTERTVKVVKAVESGRYEGKHNEQKARDKHRPARDRDAPPEGAVDRANEEVFICENGDPNLKFFPVEAVYKRWREDHLDSVMKTTDRLSSTIQAQKDAPKRQLFWPET